MLLVRDTLSAAGLCNQLGMEDSSAQGRRSHKGPEVRLAGPLLELTLSPQWPLMPP